MPTDLPPDYKPKPVNDPNDPAAPWSPGSNPAYPPTQGEDVPGDVPKPGSGTGLPGSDADSVDPAGVPAPAGTPSF